MCGIVGFTGKSKAAPLLLDGLQSLEYRGYDSAGIAVNESDEIKVYKTDKRIDGLRSQTDNGNAVNALSGIGHTRWATHGAPSIANAHPHLSQDRKFAVVHNGIIENYAEIKKELISEGFVFSSETDTEVIPMLLQKYYDGDLKAAVRKTVSRLNGSYALGILCSDFPDTVVAVKHFSPLIIGIADNGYIAASDATAIVSQTKRVVYLEDGDLALLKPDSLEIYAENGKALTRDTAEISWDISTAKKGGFEHFMMKEIHEQPKAVSDTLESYINGRRIVFENFKLTEQGLEKIDRIQIVACGSAYHAGMVGKYVLEEMLRIPVEAELASEFRYRNPIVSERTLTIIISQSGETADTLAALKEAKKRGSHILSIVNVVGSSIAKHSDDVIYTRAGPEIAVATTKGYSTQLIVLYLFAIWASRILKRTDPELTEAVFDATLLLPQKIEELLSCKAEIEKMAADNGLCDSMFFIGRNIDYAVALEASLKLKEISYIHSVAYAAGELKHGTISLIEKGKHVIALCGYKALNEKLVGNIKEVSARGAYVTACAVKDSCVENEADEIIHIPETNPLLLASLEVIPFQLYAYYVALQHGCDIDKPRNLAKSVTVE